MSFFTGLNRIFPKIIFIDFLYAVFSKRYKVSLFNHNTIFNKEIFMDNEDKHACECGHNHSGEEHDCCCSEHEHQTMTIITDENEELKCSVLGTFDVDDKEYIALLPMGEEEVLIYRFIIRDDDDFELSNIETDDEFEKVEDVFFEIFGDDAFEDDEDFDEEDFE